MVEIDVKAHEQGQADALARGREHLNEILEAIRLQELCDEAINIAVEKYNNGDNGSHFVTRNFPFKVRRYLKGITADQLTSLLKECIKQPKQGKLRVYAYNGLMSGKIYNGYVCVSYDVDWPFNN